MLAAATGRMGTGKTLSTTALGVSLHVSLGVSLHANYTLTGVDYKRIRSLKDLLAIQKGIVLLDELWLTMDSRLWKDNVKLTRWLNQTRKKDLIIIYTTQHIKQVDLRVRNATEWLIMCEKNAQKQIRLTFVDYQYGLIGKKFVIHNPSLFYPFYNTYEVLEPLASDETYGQRYLPNR